MSVPPSRPPTHSLIQPLIVLYSPVEQIPFWISATKLRSICCQIHIYICRYSIRALISWNQPITYTGKLKVFNRERICFPQIFIICANVIICSNNHLTLFKSRQYSNLMSIYFTYLNINSFAIVLMIMMAKSHFNWLQTLMKEGINLRNVGFE